MPTQTVSDTSKMQQVTIEEAQGAQSNKNILLSKEILSDVMKDLIDMHDSYRQT